MQRGSQIGPASRISPHRQARDPSGAGLNEPALLWIDVSPLPEAGWPMNDSLAQKAEKTRETATQSPVASITTWIFFAAGAAEVVGVFPNEDAIVRLVGAILLKQNGFGGPTRSLHIFSGNDGTV